ncbi:14-3-3 protein gamma-A-like [Clavelina lepadiformis]|uniref:14-3-3 protein gamma-A-like n=1 Tax=Clavelina lepadiformis TaxID=159417 RepID=UPI0040436908
MASREEFIARAKMADQAQRYEDMSTAMKAVVEMGLPLTNEEKDLLSIAYKHQAGVRRQSWRVLSSIEQKAEMENEERIDLVRQYREKVELELETLSNELLHLLDSFLLKSATDADCQIFYNKMKGDYFRYMAEITSVPEKRKKIVSSANKAYNLALTLASNEMIAVNPIRLGLALNYSVFLYEIKNMERKAISLAKSAFDDALAQVDKLKEDSYKDSTVIMQLIRDNLTLWNNSAKPQPEDPEE